MEIKDLITGAVEYDKYGGQYFWITLPNGGSQMLAEMRGWGAIQNRFKNTDGTVDFKEAARFQDAVGKWIAQAINDKLKRETEQNLLSKAAVINCSLPFTIYQTHTIRFSFMERLRILLGRKATLFAEIDVNKEVEILRGVGKTTVDRIIPKRQKGYGEAITAKNC